MSEITAVALSMSLSVLDFANQIPCMGPNIAVFMPLSAVSERRAKLTLVNTKIG